MGALIWLGFIDAATLEERVQNILGPGRAMLARMRRALSRRWGMRKHGRGAWGVVVSGDGIELMCRYLLMSADGCALQIDCLTDC